MIGLSSSAEMRALRLREGRRASRRAWLTFLAIYIPCMALVCWGTYQILCLVGGRP